jgi:uncharacterized protein with HEPN domain
MPPRDLRTCLHDILTAGDRIREVTDGLSFDEYAADWIRRAAVERQFEIIGEALRRAVQIDPSVTDRINDASRIIAFRNQVIHGYDVIDHELVWGIVQRFLPTLLEQVQATLGSHGPQSGGPEW